MTKQCTLLLSAILVLVVQAIASAQAVPAARQQQQNPWNGNALGQAIYWLANEQLMGELDILPDQQEKLTKLRNDTQTRSTEAYKGINFNDLKPEERTAKYYEIMNKIGDETAKEVERILLPHQIKRLKQIMTQTRLQQLGYGGGGSILAGDDLVKELGITDEQREKMKKMEEEVRQDMQKKYQEFYKKLQEESREKIFSVLTPEQRKKLEGLIGEKFEWKSQQPAGGQAGAAKAVEQPAKK